MGMSIKRVCAVAGASLFFVMTVFAHTPLLTVEDNGDGTIFVQGGFSNGASAGGVKVYLTSVATGEKLWEGVFPDIGELDIQIPNEPYTVTFDAGPGHVVVKDGLPPPGGFGAASAAKPENTPVESSAPAAQSAVAPAASSQISWTPQDTAAVMPSSGVSYVSLFIAFISCLNLVLLVLILRKNH